MPGQHTCVIKKGNCQAAVCTVTLLITKVCTEIRSNEIMCKLSFHVLTVTTIAGPVWKVAGGIDVALVTYGCCYLCPVIYRFVMCFMIKALGMLFPYL